MAPDRTGTAASLRHRNGLDDAIRGLLESSSDAVMLAGVDGAIVLTNQPCAELLGYAGTDELLGRNCFDLIDGLAPERILTERHESPGSIRTLERSIRRNDGSRLHVEVRTAVIRTALGDPSALVVVLRDTSAREQLEAKYRAVFDAAGDGLVIYTMDGAIAEANPAFCAMHGYASEDLIGQTVTGLIHPDSRDLFREFVRTIANGRSRYVRATHVRKDGTAFPVDVHGTVFLYRSEPHILGVIRDVTEQTQLYDLLEQRVRERTRELSTLLDVSRNVTSILELRPLLDLILDQLRTVTEYRRATIFRAELDEAVVLTEYVEPDLYRLAEDPERPPASAWPVNAALPPLTDFGPLWDALRRGETVVMDDLHQGGQLTDAYRTALAGYRDTSFWDVRSWMAVPLVIQDRTIGGIVLSHAKPSYYTPHYAQLAQIFANQAAIAIENARLYERAQQAAALEERERLARELHDAVTQTLFSASLIAEMLPRLWARDPEAGKQRLEDVRALTRGALAEMRTLLLELRPTAITEANLEDLLRQIGEVLAGRARLDVDVTVEGQRHLPPDIQLALYRVAQEALNNVEKHAKASHVDVQLRYREGGVELRISDDGAGFDPEVQSAGHFGLVNMRDRARVVGATLDVRSQPGAGTEVQVQWRGATGESGA